MTGLPADLPGGVGRIPVDQATSVAAQRRWWDREAADYYAEHGDFLGDADFVWGPEGWTEDRLGLLSPGGRLPAGPVLEIGAGAAQCSRWLAGRDVAVVATDLSAAMLVQGIRLGERSGVDLPLLQCDGTRLPFGEATFEAVFTAYGVVPFVADSAELMREVARVLRPGGRLVFSTTHPIRWAFPDEPGELGLTVIQSYFDRRPYVEADGDGVTYVEHHRTIGDRVREVVGAGLLLVDLIEPEWLESNGAEWGGWSPLRGRLFPGTLIVVAEKPTG